MLHVASPKVLLKLYPSPYPSICLSEGRDNRASAIQTRHVYTKKDGGLKWSALTNGLIFVTGGYEKSPRQNIDPSNILCSMNSPKQKLIPKSVSTLFYITVPLSSGITCCEKLINHETISFIWILWFIMHCTCTIHSVMNMYKRKQASTQKKSQININH